MSHGRPLDRCTGQDSGTSLVSEGGMSMMDVPWTSIRQVDWTGQSLRVGCPMDVHCTGGLDRTVGQALSVRVGCPMDVPWTSLGQVDWTGQWDKPGH